MEALRTISCRDRTGQDRDVVVGSTKSAVWLRVAGEERLLDETQAEALYLALGVHNAAVQSVQREAVRG